MDLLPNKLYYQEDFISNNKAQELIQYIENQCNMIPITESKNSRLVCHYGYKYMYFASNSIIDHNASEIPSIFSELINDDYYDQLIINRYLPGQGIACHIDSKNQFGNKILCISLGSDIEMEFAKNNDIHKFLIKKNSMYIMSDEVRYEYTHHIRHRKKDIINSIPKPRGIRYSLTFRKKKLNF